MLQLRKTFIKQLILELRVLNNQIKVNYVHKVKLSKAPIFFLDLLFPLGSISYPLRRRLFRSNEELVYYPPIDTLYFHNIL